MGSHYRKMSKAARTPHKLSFKDEEKKEKATEKLLSTARYRKACLPLVFPPSPPVKMGYRNPERSFLGGGGRTWALNQQDAAETGGGGERAQIET